MKKEQKCVNVSSIKVFARYMKTMLDILLNEYEETKKEFLVRAQRDPLTAVEYDFEYLVKKTVGKNYAEKLRELLVAYESDELRNKDGSKTTADDFLKIVIDTINGMKESANRFPPTFNNTNNYLNHIRLQTYEANYKLFQDYIDKSWISKLGTEARRLRCVGVKE